MESQVGLWVPYHKLFCKNYSKSAPCNCCGGGDNDCPSCTGHFPALKIHDSTYGVDTNLSSGPSYVGSNTMSANGAANCGTPTICSTISAPVTYQLSCVSGSPSYLTIVISYKYCCSPPGGNSLASSSVCGAPIGSAHVSIVNLNCTTPNIDFSVPSGAGGNPYSNGSCGTGCCPTTSGTTLTLLPQ